MDACAPSVPRSTRRLPPGCRASTCPTAHARRDIGYVPTLTRALSLFLYETTPADPLADIRNTRQIQTVWIGGRRLADRTEGSGLQAPRVATLGA